MLGEKAHLGKLHRSQEVVIHATVNQFPDDICQRIAMLRAVFRFLESRKDSEGLGAEVLGVVETKERLGCRRRLVGSAAKKFFVALENLGHHIPNPWFLACRLRLGLWLMLGFTELQGFLLENGRHLGSDAWAGCHKISPFHPL